MSKRYPGNFITGNPVALSQSSNNGIFDLKDQYHAISNGTWQETDGVYESSKSLRFRYSSPAFLNRTPATVGNRRTWTKSVWVKRGASGDGTGSGHMFLFNTGASSQEVLDFYQNTIRLYFTGGTYLLQTTQRFLDYSAWYHIVWTVDTTLVSASERVKLYVNGERVTAFSTNIPPPQNFDCNNNNATVHNIGYNGASNYFDGYMAEINHIDGQALDASYFGYTDSITGIWQPKKYTGAYGTNGFYLPFNCNGDFSTLLADKRSDNTTPNSNGLTVTQNNNATLSNTQTLYGSTSLRMAGLTSSTIGTASSPDMKSGSQDFTAECWVRLDTVTNSTEILCSSATSGADATSTWNFAVNASGKWLVFCYFSGTYGSIASTATATANTWTHLVAQRIGSTMYFHVNGVSQGSLAVSGSMIATSGQAMTTSTSNVSGWTGSVGYLDSFRYTHGIGRYGTGTFTSPTAAFPVGEFDPYWGGTTLVQYYGMNGSASSSALCYSSNYFLSSGISLTAGTTYDSMVDSPTNVFTSATDIGGVVPGNYCTWNSVSKSSTITLTEANLKTIGNTADWCAQYATMGAQTGGKWYWEYVCYPNSNSSQGFCKMIGIVPPTAIPSNTYIGNASYGYGLWVPDGSGGTAFQKRYNGTGTTMTGYTSGYALTNGDVIQVAYDAVNGQIWFGKNNTWFEGNPSAGTGASYTSIDTSVQWLPAINEWYAVAMTNNYTQTNFGQRPFAYTPPTGFKSLNTTNLQALGTAAVGSSAIQSNKWFDATLYAGTGQSISVVNSAGFAPDFVWVKVRNQAYSHSLNDTARGTNNRLQTDVAGAEGAAGILSFNSNGFNNNPAAGELGTAGNSYVAWQWKQSPAAGFNIVTYTGNGGTQSISHNLGVAPAFAIYKARTGSTSWLVYHKNLNGGVNPQNYYLVANTTATTAGPLSNIFVPTSSNFTVTDYGAGNPTGVNMVAYLWAEVPGFSKFGSWTNNNSTDGVFVYTGFRPSCILLKNTDNVECWYIEDNKRRTYNIAPGSDTNHIQINTATAEGAVNASTATIDFLSNGFKIRTSNTASGEISFGTRNYVYAAWAESPFGLNNRAR